MKDNLFAASLAHELKNPLVSILGYANIINDPSSSSEDKTKALEVIKRNAEKQLEIVDSLVEFTRVETNKSSLNLSVFRFRDIIEELFEEYLPLVDKKGIRLIVNNGFRNFVEADKIQIYRLFSNLVSNAIKFTDSGSVTIDIRYQGEFLKVQVSDTGIGIPDPSGIFEPFHQVGNRESGLGLGLYMCKRIADLHSGSINVNSSSSGTSFTVLIPLGRARSFSAKNFKSVTAAV